MQALLMLCKVKVFMAVNLMAILLLVVEVEGRVLVVSMSNKKASNDPHQARGQQPEVARSDAVWHHRLLLEATGELAHECLSVGITIRRTSERRSF